MTDIRTRMLALRELGLPALLPYVAYRLSLATGLIELRSRAADWEDQPLGHWLGGDIPLQPAGYVEQRAAIVGPRFFFGVEATEVPWSSSDPPPADLMREAEEILAGRFRLFGGPPVDLGFPPDWFAFPPPLATRAPLKDLRHWSKIALDEPGADVRLVWELSRFGWAFPLARAYRWTGEVKYAEGCWRLIEDWCRANPPNRGVHWASGQEVALRVLALAFAERACFPDWRRRPERLQSVTRAVRFHAARIPPTLAYARAQGNNHLLSEAAGLYTAGLLYPELHESGRWRRIGRRLLEQGFERQVFPDGGYVQHSANYQHLALGLGVWSARLAELNHEPLRPETLLAIARLARSLAIQADPTSGRTSSFGPDDGSDVLPLSTVQGGDVRPVTTAASCLALGESWFPPGPWDETSRWLGVNVGVPAEPPRSDSLMDTGLHYLTGAKSRASFRCVEFHERPGHSDQLHVDLWWNGRLLVFDPGSYLYNGPPPWQDGLAGAVVHNAPVIDGQGPMQRAGRFLWAGRAQGRFEGRTQEYGIRELRGVHYGYRRLGLTVSRSVSAFDDRAWMVTDRVMPQSRTTGRELTRRLTVGWNLPDLAWEWLPEELHLAGDGSGPWLGWDGCFHSAVRAGLARAGDWIAGEPVDGPVALWGWTSPRYSAIEPCLRLVLEVSGRPPLCLRTRLSPTGEWPHRLLQVWDDAYLYGL